LWVNVPLVLAALVLSALFVPESRAARPRRFDPVGQVLVLVVLVSLVFAIIESASLGWTSPVILCLLAVAALGIGAIVAYEPGRADPLLELRLFRSHSFSAAILLAFGAMLAFGAFLFITTLYLQQVRGLPALAAGLCLLPLGVPIVVLAPLTGRFFGARGPRLPLVIAGTALAGGGVASLGIGPAPPLPLMLATYLFFGVSQGTVNAPITNSAVAGMPRSMAGLATSLASTGRQVGVTLGVAIAGTVAGSRPASAYGIWLMVVGIGVGIVLIALVSTRRPATVLFDEPETPREPAGRFS
jgi:predicted MFS family arabinose efflux permease